MMKVKSVAPKAKVKGKSTAKVATPSISFLEILEVEEDDKARQMLSEALELIEEKGKSLSNKRTVEALIDYKKMVQNFIKEAVEYGLKVEEKRGFSRGGRGRSLRTVSSIDARLIELTEAILKQEKKHINILDKVGEIQGLLVNLYL